ncbi:MAG: D-alanyl-D-alanine carboxypeptidase [Patescibacteria group bacterium]
MSKRSKHRKKRTEQDAYLKTRVEEISEAHSPTLKIVAGLSASRKRLFSTFSISLFLILVSVSIGSLIGSLYYKKNVLGASSKAALDSKEATFSGQEKKTTYSPFLEEVKRQGIVEPEILATSAIVVSSKTRKILYEKEPDLKLPPASTTKILTALIAIKEFNLGDLIEVSETCTKVEGAKIGLRPSEKISVESLLYGVLVASAGDAACALSSNLLSEQAFVTKMNELAREIGVTNTNFTNAIGLDSSDGGHVSTARDLYIMASNAMKNGVFRKIVGTKEEVLYSKDLKLSHPIRSTNKLLFEIPGALGIKTGKTEKAKEVLVFSYQYKDDEIITIVMGSSDRFADTKKLIEFVDKNYSLLL